ncbi:hypothetical protein SKAU_G00298920 [Synaphobranchus kaupii]|uniref:Uncharacterized protein n=1 Tax=Synaphobranchus kaupii TaxID=118154 RepID=A0A9Q1EVA3_SYNKA|nr:hypothetical protein SKAU_G00298920 [Synaphobranchus kaupii]
MTRAGVSGVWAILPPRRYTLEAGLWLSAGRAQIPKNHILLPTRGPSSKIVPSKRGLESWASSYSSKSSTAAIPSSSGAGVCIQAGRAPFLSSFQRGQRERSREDGGIDSEYVICRVYGTNNGGHCARSPPPTRGAERLHSHSTACESQPRPLKRRPRCSGLGIKQRGRPERLADYPKPGESGDGLWSRCSPR